jgi:membrane protein implicated in regulation of membrane protease activity
MCRARHLNPTEAKKERAKNAGTLLLLFAGLGLAGVFLLSLPTGSGSGIGVWIRFLGSVLASIVGAVAIFIGAIMLLNLLRRRQLRTEQGLQAVARKCAGEEGAVVNEGKSSIWYSGADSPLPMLREAMDAGRRRFTTLTGGAEVAEPALRILVFHDRGAFVRFHRRNFGSTDFSSFDGFYLAHPYRLATLCTAPVIGRVTDPERTMRSLTGHALLGSVCGPAPTPWLQSGLPRSTANVEDTAGLARLNRKMLASLAGGTAMTSEIFTLSGRGVRGLTRGSSDPWASPRYRQFNNQAWSIVEYLAGEHAPRDLRGALGAFLRDPRCKSNQEESFREHFGSSFGSVLDGWRQWVLDHGIGAFEPPPPLVRDGLLNRVLPVIRDHHGKRGDRLVAIREWANLGFILGANSLIDLLRDPGDIPSEEIAGALAAVSGMAFGDDPERWLAWWDDRQSTSGDALTAAPASSGRADAKPIVAG